MRASSNPELFEHMFCDLTTRRDCNNAVHVSNVSGQFFLLQGTYVRTESLVNGRPRYAKLEDSDLQLSFLPGVAWVLSVQNINLMFLTHLYAAPYMVQTQEWVFGLNDDVVIEQVQRLSVGCSSEWCVNSSTSMPLDCSSVGRICQLQRNPPNRCGPCLPVSCQIDS